MMSIVFGIALCCLLILFEKATGGRVHGVLRDLLFFAVIALFVRWIIRYDQRGTPLSDKAGKTNVPEPDPEQIERRFDDK
jgi:hypothetical protein